MAFVLKSQWFLIPLKYQELQQGGVTDEAEPFMGSGRFGKHINLAFMFNFLGLNLFLHMNLL